MANDWIKMTMNLHEKPEVIVISGALRMDRFAVVGRLHRLWSWFDAQSHNGHTKGVTGVTVDELTNCDGFAAALEKAGWLIEDDDGITIPSFDRHNGESAKKRANNTERKRLNRLKKQQQEEESKRSSQEKCDDGHTKSVTEARPEKRREEKSISTTTLQREGANDGQPVLEDVMKMVGSTTYPLTHACADAYFYDRESVGWMKKGQPITNWRADLARFASHWNTNERNNVRKSTSTNARSTNQRSTRGGAGSTIGAEAPGSGIDVPNL